MVSSSPLLSLVVPTLNEVENLPILLPRLAGVLQGIRHEIVVVDDGSSDGTPELVESCALERPNLRLLRRSERPGLSASILDGFRAARGEALAVLDADLQHDETLLPRMLAALEKNEVAVGSRYAFRGRTRGWSYQREAQSKVAAWVSRVALGLVVKDPLSGFFMIRRALFEQIQDDVGERGWKVLLEILAAAPSVSVAEVPYVFRGRLHGRTKMNIRVMTDWLLQLSRLTWRSRAQGHARASARAAR